MLKNFLWGTAICCTTLAITTPANSQAIFLDPQASCATVLSGKTNKAAIWAFGYLSHMEGENRAITRGSMTDMASQLTTACEAADGLTFSQLVAQTFVPAEQAQNVGVTSADPQALLDLFADGTADLAEILLPLKPTPEDIHAMFAEPVASEMIEMYDQLFGRRLATEDFPTPFVLAESAFSTTKSLENDNLLEDLPGGFAQVLDLYLQDVPFGAVIIHFPTEDDQMELEGFVYVNGHWTLMMSPWRAL